MHLVRHNETADRELLNVLPVRLRVLFSLLCANRLRPAYERFCEKTGRGDSAALQGLLERLWRDLNGDLMTPDEAQIAVDRATELVPSEEDGWDEETQPYAEDAAAALAYAFRARVTGDPQEAAWAGRRAYEAADHWAGKMLLRAPIVSTEDEVALLSHPVVQAELARQQRDLRDLREFDRAGTGALSMSEMRTRSEREAELFFQAK